MAIKIILLDLDGTLLTSDKQISPRNRAALEKAADAGIHIIPSTGRFYDGMPKVVRELPFVRYVITVNGAQVYDAKEDRILHRAEITPEQAEAVFDRLDTLPVIYDCFQDGWGYMDALMYDRIDDFIADPVVNRMVRELRTPVPDFRKKIQESGKSLQKIQMFFRDLSQKQPAWDALVQEFPYMSITSSIINNVEINDSHANKGEALRFLAAHLSVDIQETMAFGDGTNDLSMIQAAGMGVAMENADPLLKANADLITDTNDGDGVAKAIEAYCF